MLEFAASLLDPAVRRGCRDLGSSHVLVGVVVLSAIAALPFTVGVVLVATAVSALLETVVRRMGSTKDYRWTVRVGLGGVGFLATLVAFVAVTRIFNVVIAGVQPEAWALTAMMTAPLTIGVVSLATVGTAVVETVARLKRTEVGA